MSLTLFKTVSAIIILFIAVGGGLWPFFRKAATHKTCTHGNEADFPVGESFASGIFLGAGLLHMLPDAASAFLKAGYNYPFAFLIAASIFLLLLLLEHISVSMQHKKNHMLSSIVLLTVIMLAIHSLFEGTAVGMSADFATTLVIFIAIIAHKGAASFALSTSLNRSNLSFVSRVSAFSIFAVMTPFGIFAGDWISISSHNILLTPIFSALAAGTFLYIGTLHGLARASLIKYCCNMKEFCFMLLGFSIMAVVAVWT